MRQIALFTAYCLFCIFVQAAAVAQAFELDASSGIGCEYKKLPIEEQRGETVTLFTEICSNHRPGEGAVVQILLHGGTYDHRYWNWPNRPDQHSYVHSAAKRGYVTVNPDRLGYGRSSRPAGHSLTFERGAAAISQLVTMIGQGSLGFVPETIVLNGHSMGGIIAELVAEDNPMVDALVISGLSNNATDGKQEDQSNQGGPPVDAFFMSAAEDARFSASPEIDGYLTTVPLARSALFHGSGSITEENLWIEELVKSTVAVSEIAAVQSVKPPRAERPVPSLYVLGQFDHIACEGQDCLKKFTRSGMHQIIKGAGHSLNSSERAGEFYDLTFTWLQRHGLAPESARD